MADKIEDGDCDFINVPAETPLSPEEAIIRRHRREKKELQGKIVAMKKKVCMTDKKKKKELADEVAKLEAELEERHRVELDTFQPKRLDLGAADIPPTVEETPSEAGDVPDTNPEAPGTPKMSKARRRREKKEAEEKERQKRIEAETEELTENSDRSQEDKLLEQVLKNLKLEVVDIPSDGHCLYKALGDQLRRVGEKWEVNKLRSEAANYLRKHKEDFIHFVDEDYSSDSGFEKYCGELESTAAWGGQIEVQALSQVLGRPVKVIQADGPPLMFGEEYKKPGLILTFHRHKFQLGAHYNSAVPKTEDD